MGDPSNGSSLTPRHPVTFDRDTLRLSIGVRSVIVPDPSAGNEAMLWAYLSLVAEVRGTAIGSGIELRQDDVVVLAEILDLSDRDLEAHLVNLLGVSANEAADVHRRIRKHRALAAAASLSVGGLALLGATNLPAAATPKANVVHMVGVTTSAPSGPIVVVVPQNAAPPSPSSHSQTASDDIGNAMVIERGTQPDDPQTQVDNAVTYER